VIGGTAAREAENVPNVEMIKITAWATSSKTRENEDKSKPTSISGGTKRRKRNECIF